MAVSDEVVVAAQGTATIPLHPSFSRPGTRDGHPAEITFPTRHTTMLTINSS